MTTLFFPAAIWLDSHPLTDQGRAPVEVTREEIFVENELANASKRRYFKGVKESWSLSWTMLPDSSVNTIDQKAARNDIRTILGNQGKSYTLRFYNNKQNFTQYNVFCESYDESLFRRDPVSNIFLWDVNLSLVEI